MPKISVIVPVYNVERFLPRCLDSILSQSLRDIEIICVDDGSPDNSIDILRRYEAADGRIKVIRQQNRGLGGARNTGLSAACGEWVGFVDSDDWIDRDFYEKLYTAAISTEADMACAGIVKHRPYSSKYLVKHARQEAFDTVNDKFKACNCPPDFYVMNKIYRRETLLSLGLVFKEHVMFEDIEFTSHALCGLGRLVCVSDTFYRYIFNGGSIINSRQTPKKQLDKYNARKALLVFADSNGIRIPNRYRNIPVRTFSVGPVCLLKIRERDGKRSYRLFDLVPVFRKKV